MLADGRVRIAVDTGGTFTDLVLDPGDGHLRAYKAPTTPADPGLGIFAALELAADDLDVALAELLGAARVFVHGTTRAINAIVTGTTARTALLVTEGHPDILVFGEGGRDDLFNYTRPAPQPYVPRALTFEVPERIGADGEVVAPLDEEAVRAILRGLDVEAVAVCLLWSPVNGDHERRVGELVAEELPGVAVTLSHELNPIPREYRRASSAAIDASLKPVMSAYLRDLGGRLVERGFAGRLLVPVSSGGVMDADAVAAAPIHSINSGPAMGTIAGRAQALLESDATTAVVADAGGTTFDVSLVRDGRLPRTTELWLGGRERGQMSGFPSVDVRSIGAAGGSIAGVDAGGVLFVGPASAGADPGPACYGRGGTKPTLTDACLILGYLDPEFFLGGSMRLDAERSVEAIRRHVALPLGIDVEQAAGAVVRLATEHMARGIEEITLYQGVDPASAVLIAGGGAAGLNAVAIARRLGCRQVVIPASGPVMSAAGALEAPLSADYAATLATTTAAYDARIRDVLADLRARCDAFVAAAGADPALAQVDVTVGARYPSQVWELEVPLREGRLEGKADLQRLADDFHALHAETFSVADRGSVVELVTWRATVTCPLDVEVASNGAAHVEDVAPVTRLVHFPTGPEEAVVHRLDAMEPGRPVAGPALVDSRFTTVVLEAGASARRGASGSLVIDPGAG